MIGQRNVAGSAASLLKAAGDAEETRPPGRPQGPARPGRPGRTARPAEASWSRPGRPRRSQAAENALSALCARQSEPASGNIVIVKAEYGDLPDGPSADVTKKVADLVKAGALAVEASNGNFGDPANGIAKKLRVDYTVNGVPVSKTVARGGER